MAGKRLGLASAALTAAAALATGGAFWPGTPAHASARNAVLTAKDMGAPRHAARRGMLLAAPLAASVPTDPAIFGTSPGKLPWVIRSGHVRLGGDGALRAHVSGLVVPAQHRNPLPQITAAVYCDGRQVARTAPVPFSRAGRARIAATVALPRACAAPAVLLEPPTANAAPAMYIAFDGRAS